MGGNGVYIGAGDLIWVCFFEFYFFEEQSEDGRVEEWKVGRMEVWAMVSGAGPERGVGPQWRTASACHQAMGNEGFATGCCSAFMDEDPPFVDKDEAEALIV